MEFDGEAGGTSVIQEWKVVMRCFLSIFSLGLRWEREFVDVEVTG